MAGMKLADGPKDLWDVWSSAGNRVAHRVSLETADAILQDVQAAEDARAAAFAQYEKESDKCVKR
jgi:hypothetical protein